MRNALIERAERYAEMEVSLYDYSTSVLPAIFNPDPYELSIRDQDWSDDEQQFGDGDNTWSLYADVTALSYRLDLLLVGHGPAPSILVNVECDGHEWHERTKQQASADRARDRELLRYGIVTIRFTGSDIFNRADECGREAWDLALALLSERDDRRQIIFKSGYWSGRQEAERQLKKESAEAIILGAIGGLA